MIIDSAEWEIRNPSKTLSFSERAITLRDAVFNIPTNYEIPIKNIGSIPLTIDSITLSGSISDFILDTTYKKTIPPNQLSNINIQFLHNTAGDVECTFIIHTNLKQVLPGINDSIANPTFLLKGKVNRGNLDISKNGCNFFYLNAKAQSCQCKYEITFINNGQANILIDSIGFSGESQNFTFKPNDLKARRILGPNEYVILEVIPNPQTKDVLEYPGKITIYSNATNYVPTTDVSYKTVQPEIRLSSTGISAKTGENITIPINFSLINYPGDDIAIIDSFFIEFPEESRHAMSDIRLTLDDMILPSNDASYYIIEDSLNVMSKNGDKRFYNMYRNSFSDPTDPNWFMHDKIGTLSFNYFLNEHDTIRINIKELRVRDRLGRCYNSLTLKNVPIIVQRDDDEFCLESLNDFFTNIRNSTNDFIASLRVSGEPVMEIQHFFKETTFAQISLYSVNGMKLETVFSGMAPAELHQFRHPMSHLPPGVYFCEMVAGQFRKTIPIILNR
ncbi:MAG: hypothetical protein ACK5EE_05455 [Ignavibacteria bacterium]